MPLAQQFAQDRQGRRFADVLNDARISFPAILAFFNDSQRQRRLIESELHHDRPALAGVICELEHRQDVDQFFRTNDGHMTTRFRQAIGVVVRIIMESHGWKTTGRKGSLGVRVKAPSRTTTAGAYHNTGGLAVWFTRAERYQLVAGSPFRSVEERADEIEAANTLLAVERPPS
jgi:hypothetical protein